MRWALRQLFARDQPVSLAANNFAINFICFVLLSEILIFHKFIFIIFFFSEQPSMWVIAISPVAYTLYAFTFAMIACCVMSSLYSMRLLRSLLCSCCGFCACGRFLSKFPILFIYMYFNEVTLLSNEFIWFIFDKHPQNALVHPF